MAEETQASTQPKPKPIDITAPKPADIEQFIGKPAEGTDADEYDLEGFTSLVSSFSKDYADDDDETRTNKSLDEAFEFHSQRLGISKEKLQTGISQYTDPNQIAYDISVEKKDPKEVYEGLKTRTLAGVSAKRQAVKKRGEIISQLGGLRADAGIGRTVEETGKVPESLKERPAPSLKIQEERAGFFGTDTEDVDELPKKGDFAYEELQSLNNMMEDAALENASVNRIIELRNRYGTDETGAQKYVDERTQDILNSKNIRQPPESAFEGKTKEEAERISAEYDYQQRKAQNRAVHEIAIWKTIGVWTAPTFIRWHSFAPDKEKAPDDETPTNKDKPVGEKLTWKNVWRPTVEIVGMNRDGQPIGRMESGLQWGLEMSDILQSAATGVISEPEGSLSQKALKGVAERQNFLEAALASDMYKKGGTAGKIAAGTSGFLAAVLFPDLTFGAAGAYQATRKAVTYQLTKKVAKDAIGFKETAAKALARGLDGDREALKEAAKASSDARDIAPKAMDEVDTNDFNVGRRLGKHNPDVMNGEQGKDLAARLPGELGQNQMNMHPAIRRRTARMGGPDARVVDEVREAPGIAYDEVYDYGRQLDLVDEARTMVNAQDNAIYTRFIKQNLTKAGSKLLESMDSIRGITVARVLSKAQDYATLARDPAAWKNAALRALDEEMVAAGTRDPAHWRGGVESVLDEMVDIAKKTIDEGDDFDDMAMLINRAEEAIKTNIEARAVAHALQREIMAGQLGLEIAPIIAESTGKVSELMGRKMSGSNLEYMSEEAIGFMDEIIEKTDIPKEHALEAAVILDLRAKMEARKSGFNEARYWKEHIAGIGDRADFMKKMYAPPAPYDPKAVALASLPEGFTVELKEGKWLIEDAQGKTYSSKYADALDAAADAIDELVNEGLITKSDLDLSATRVGPLLLGQPISVVEDVIRRLPIEYAMAHTDDGVHVIRQTSNAPNYVSFSTQETIRMMKAPNLKFTHNHPSGGAFSGADIKYGTRLDARQMRATQPGGGAWVLDVPNGFDEISDAVLIEKYGSPSAIPIDKNVAKRKFYQEIEDAVSAASRYAAEQIRSQDVQAAIDRTGAERAWSAYYSEALVGTVDDDGILRGGSLQEILGRRGIDHTLTRLEPAETGVRIRPGDEPTFGATARRAAAQQGIDLLLQRLPRQSGFEFREVGDDLIEITSREIRDAAGDAEGIDVGLTFKVDGGVLRIESAALPDAVRGRGLGTELYLKAFSRAADAGLGFASDVSPSPDAIALYERLIDAGMPLRRKMVEAADGSMVRQYEATAEEVKQFNLKPEFAKPPAAADVATAGAKTPADVEEAKRLWKEMGAESPYFKRWFGKSKVVDADGNPLVLYHGTASDFDTFDQPFNWVSTDTATANRYAKYQSETFLDDGIDKIVTRPPSVVPLYARVEAPFDADSLSETTTIQSFVTQILKQSPKGIDRLKGDKDKILAIRKRIIDGAKKNSRADSFERFELWHESSYRFGEDGAKAIKELLEATGFDSVKMTERGATTYGVLNPNQIKSKFNIGTFDPKDPRILYQGKPPAAGVRELYHSSPVEFKEFQISPRGKFLSGVYLSDASKASEYAGRKGLGFGPGVGEEGVGYTYKVEVDTSDFLDWHQPITDSDYEVFSKAIDELGADGAAAVATHKQSRLNRTLGGFLNSLRGGRGGQGSRAGDRYAKNVAQKAGYKGVKGTSGVTDVARTADQAAEEIVVFDPADIKIISTTKVGEDVAATAAKIDTPEFKRWFGKSKVVDEAGEPLVVYHAGYFDELDDSIPIIKDEGMHFGTKAASDIRRGTKESDDMIRGARYEKAADEDGNLRWWWSTDDGMESFDIDHRGFDSVEDAKRHLQELAVSMREFSDTELPLTTAYLSIKNPKRVVDQGDDWTDAVAKAKAEGHDGIVYRNEYEDRGSTSYIVFEPTQIKSVENPGTFDPKDPRILKQEIDDTAKGAVEFLDDGRAIIYAFEEADFSTLVHEIGHIIRRDLDPADMDEVLGWVKELGADVTVTAGRFMGDPDEVRKAEEFFAEAFENYIMTGEAPAKGLEGMFQRMKDFMLGIYKTISPVAKPSPAIKKTFDKLLVTEPPSQPVFKRVMRLIGTEIFGPTDDRKLNVFRELSREAQRMGVPNADYDTLIEQFETTGKITLDKGVYYSRYGGTGKAEFGPNDLAELRKSMESEIASQASTFRPGVATTSAAQGLTELKPTERIEHMLRGDESKAKIGSIVKSTFMGGDVVAERKLGNLVPEIRASVETATREVQQGAGEVIRLVAEGAEGPGSPGWDNLLDYLSGKNVRYTKGGRNVMTSGHDSTEAIFNSVRRYMEDVLLPDGRLDALVGLANRTARGDTLESIGFSPDTMPIRGKKLPIKNAMEEAWTSTFREQTSPMFFNDLLRSVAPATHAGAKPLPKEFMKFTEIVMYYSGKSVRDGEKFTGTSRQLADGFLNEIRETFDPESASRVAILMGVHGHADRARKIWAGLGLAIDETAKNMYLRWLNGEDIPPQYIGRVKDLVKRFGIQTSFVETSLLDTTFYVPQAARNRLNDAIMRGIDPQLDAGKWATAEENITGLKGVVLRYMKTRMTRGGVAVRQRYFLMNTIDHFVQMAIINGFRPALSSTIKVLAQDVMVLPGVARSIDLMERAARAGGIPVDIAEGLRRKLQTGGDTIGRFMSGAKYNLNVNPILEGAEGHVRLGGNIYTYRELREIAVQEGIFASFDTSQLANSVNRAGRELLTQNKVGAKKAGMIKARADRFASQTGEFLTQVVADTSEAWAERERLGAMVSLMEFGTSPRVAARLTIDSLYDYAGTMSKMDRAWFVSLALPFWAFQKNANRQIINAMLSPAGAYRMGVLRRSQERGADLLANLLYYSVTDEYGVDTEAMAEANEELYTEYITLREKLEDYYAKQGIPVPDDTKTAFRMWMAGRSSIIDKGKVIDLSGEFKKLTGAGSVEPKSRFMEFTRGVVSHSRRRTYMRERTGVPVPVSLQKEAVRRYYNAIRSKDQDHPYIEVFVPDSTINAGFRHITNLASFYILSLDKTTNFIQDRAFDEDSSQEGIDEVSPMTALRQVVDLERSLIAGDVIRLATDKPGYPKRVHPWIADRVEETFSVKMYRTLPKDDMMGIPDKREGVEFQQERVYMFPGAWQILFDNSPLGELNNTMIQQFQWKGFDEGNFPIEPTFTPLERESARGRMLAWARAFTGVQTAETSGAETARREEPTRMMKTKRPE